MRPDETSRNGMPQTDVSSAATRERLAKYGAFGVIPRVLSGVVAALFTGGVALAISDGVSWLVALFAVVPLVVFALSLRIGARIEGDSLIVQSYLRRYVLPHRDNVFVWAAPYSGLWNNNAGGDSWWNGHLHMLEVASDRTRRELPATMMRKRRCVEVAALLDRWAEAGSQRHEPLQYDADGRRL